MIFTVKMNVQMNITYTFPDDCPLPQLRGVTFTGGRMTKTKIDGELIDAIVFDAPLIDGRTITARLDNKPDLQAIVASAKEAADIAAAAKQAAIEESVPGLASYEAAMSAYSNALADYERASQYGYPAKEAAAAESADNALQAVHVQYPATVAWRKIESFCQASNYDKSAAGDVARRSVEAGNDIFEAVAKMESDWQAAAERAVWNS